MYAVLNMGWAPSDFNNLPPKDKAFVIASIQTKTDAEKQERAKLKK